MILTKRIPQLDSKAKLLSIVTIAHGTNDFYGVVLSVLLPVIVLDFGFSYTQFGVVLLITTISSGLLPPVFGFLADRHGIQKQIVMIGFLMFALGLVGFSIAASFLTLIVASLIYGLGQTTYHPQATSLITSIFSENKGRAMGVHGIGGSVGNFLAPITVAFLITLVDWRMTAILLAIPTITLIGVTFTTWKNRPKNLNLTLTSGITRNVIVLGVTTGFITMFYKGFLAFLPTWLLENGVTLTSAGAITSLMLVIGIIAQPVGGVLYDQFGGRILYTLSAIVAGIALMLMTAVGGWLVIPMIVVIGAALAMTFPVGLTMASALVTGDDAGTSVGVVYGIGALMSAVTLFVTGFLADQFGLGVAIQLLGVLLVLTVLMAIFVLHPEKRKRKHKID